MEVSSVGTGDIAVLMTLRTLPRPTGPWSHYVREVLQRRSSGRAPALPRDRFDDDAQYAWFLLNCASYQGWEGVDDDAEWDPNVVALRRRFERWFVDDMRRRCVDGPVDPRSAVQHALAPGGSPGIASFLEHGGTAEQVRESLVLRLPYQHQEADPHTWAVPRLRGEVKRALCDIQAGEYGSGTLRLTPNCSSRHSKGRVARRPRRRIHFYREPHSRRSTSSRRPA